MPGQWGCFSALSSLSFINIASQINQSDWKQTQKQTLPHIFYIIFLGNHHCSNGNGCFPFCSENLKAWSWANFRHCMVRRGICILHSPCWEFSYSYHSNTTMSVQEQFDHCSNLKISNNTEMFKKQNGIILKKILLTYYFKGYVGFLKGFTCYVRRKQKSENTGFYDDFCSMGCLQIVLF